MNQVSSPLPLNMPDLKTVSTDALRQRLADALTITANALCEMAFIWRELESRGEDLSGLRSGLTVYLPLIADSRLLPEVVVQYAGNRRLLEAMARVTRDDQQSLLDAGTVTVYLPYSGSTTNRTIADMNTPEIQQVFGTDRLRSPEEQQRFLESQALPQMTSQHSLPRDNLGLRFRYGALEYEGARIQKTDGKPVRADELLEALSQHYGVDLAAVIGKHYVQGKTY